MLRVGHHLPTTRLHLTIVVTTLGIAALAIAFELFQDYRAQLRHLQHMVTAAVDSEVRLHLAAETGGDLGRIEPTMLGRIVEAHVAMPELNLFALVRDGEGNILGATGLDEKQLETLRDLKPTVSNRFVERGALMLYPTRLSGDTGVAVGFDTREVLWMASRSTRNTGALALVLLLLYYVLVFRRLRRDVEEPLTRFFDDKLTENVHSLVLGKPRTAHSHASLEFLPAPLATRVRNSVALLDTWAQHKVSLDRFIAMSIREVDRHELFRNLERLLREELPLKDLLVHEINRSQNRLEPVYASTKPVCREDIFSEPKACVVYRSGAPLTQYADDRFCEACTARDDPPSLCVPLVAGSTQIGVCKVVLDEARLADVYPGVSDIREKLDVVSAFLGPYVNLAALTLSNLNLLEAYKNQALTDALTGLYNRRYLTEYMTSVLNLSKRHETKLSVLMVDVDDFKRLNDEFGHKVGDIVLRKLAQVMRRAMRDADVIGRFGGEEFIAVLPGTDQTTAVEVAERMRAAVAEVDWAEEEALGTIPRVTISIGVAEFPLHGYSHYHLANAADRALYRAKREGKNRVVLHQALPAE